MTHGKIVANDPGLSKFAEQANSRLNDLLVLGPRKTGLYTERFRVD
jgi:hypothetical protein